MARDQSLQEICWSGATRSTRPEVDRSIIGDLTVSADCQELVDHHHSTQQALATLPSLNLEQDILFSLNPA